MKHTVEVKSEQKLNGSPTCVLRPHKKPQICGRCWQVVVVVVVSKGLLFSALFLQKNTVHCEFKRKQEDTFIPFSILLRKQAAFRWNKSLHIKQYFDLLFMKQKNGILCSFSKLKNVNCSN